MVKKLVGYVIGTEREDFLAAVEGGPGRMVCTYVAHPDLALKVPAAEARRLVRAIGKPGVEALPVYDMGSQWGVDWRCPLP